MKKAYKQFVEQIDALALNTVMLDPGDIPALGEVLKSLEAMEGLLGRAENDALCGLVRGMKGFIERVILGETSDLTPFEEAVSRLQEVSRRIASGKEMREDFTPLLERLSGLPVPLTAAGGPGDRGDKREEKPGADSKAEASPSMLGEEDIEIISDFVSESLENLAAIEVRLMELEQDPADLETINAVFRPFHTIKGVSGFLNFHKINRLSHVSENLLDLARNGELGIDGELIDVILDSVDVLKRLIDNVRNTLDRGSPSEGEAEIDGIVSRIEQIVDHARDGSRKPLGELLVEKGVVSRTDVEDALQVQEEEPGKRIGEILIERDKVETREVVSAIREQKRCGAHAPLQVKVDTAKLDNIVDMVGELAIAQAMLRQNDLIKRSGDQRLDQITNQLNLITSNLQKTAMSLRMVPIKNTFQKMLRLVRDLARKAGKEVQLIMAGEDTEIDRNMVEELYDPMVHMIRNSIDHGLETPEEREAANKPRQGSIHLRAYHKGGNIVIEIQDDGRGLDREKIVDKAMARGLIGNKEELTDAEINNLIFQPGFSTAQKVTDISGRGVGMDVVKSRIVEKLRGRVDLESIPGQGTTFFIRLPLTLAIVDGMIVKVSGERYIIPTLAVQESFRPRKNEYHTVKGKGEMIRVRENLLPVIRLDQALGLNGNNGSSEEALPPWEKLVVVVENQESRRCLLVDELLGQDEVVIKSLGGWLNNVKGIAGGAILGDGRVGLILDVAGIFNLVSGGA